MTSLNPVFRIGAQITDSLILHKGMNKAQADARAVEMLGMVGLPNPEKCFRFYPHQLSGGMRQRAMIAMALACEPRVLIADEPTTALDVTIQAQILKLLADIRERLSTAVMLITHDMGVVAQVAKNVMVMYAGEVVEYASVGSLFADTRHPYTVGLVGSIPNLNEQREMLYNIPGAVPSPLEYPPGCRFAPRCDRAGERCRNSRPPLADPGDAHKVRCWQYAGGVDA